MATNGPGQLSAAVTSPHIPQAFTLHAAKAISAADNRQVCKSLESNKSAPEKLLAPQPPSPPAPAALPAPPARSAPERCAPEPRPPAAGSP